MAFQPINFADIAPQGNVLAQELMPSIAKGIETSYLPKTLRADIFSKTFSPLAQIAASPLAMAMLPEQKSQINTLISNLLSQQGGGAPGSSTPTAEQGIWGNTPYSQAVSNAMGGSADGSPSGAPSPSLSRGQSPNYRPDIPTAGRGVGAGATAQELAPTQSQTHKPGESYYDPASGKYYMQPTETQINQAQTSINAIKRATPQLKIIPQKAKEFLDAGGMAKLRVAQALGHAKQYGVDFTKQFGRFGVDPDIVSRYADLQSNLKLASESIINAFPNLSHAEGIQNNLMNALYPLDGETSEGYEKRVNGILKNLSIQNSLLAKQSEPISLSEDMNPETAGVAQIPEEAPVTKKPSNQRKYSRAEIKAEMDRRRKSNG